MKIVHASELKKRSNLRILYSNPGLGKTTSIQFMPGRKLVIDIDGTSNVLKNKPNIDIVKIENPNNIREELPKMLAEIKKSYLAQYESIALDNISELESAVLTEFGKKGNNHGVPGIQNYQQLQFFELDLIRFLKSFNKNILITAWEQTDEFTDETTGQSFTRTYPKIRKPILTNVMGLALQVGKLIISPKNSKRYVILKPTNAVFAKNQIDDREFCEQKDLWSDESVSAVSVPAKTSQSSTAKTSSGK